MLISPQDLAKGITSPITVDFTPQSITTAGYTETFEVPDGYSNAVFEVNCNGGATVSLQVTDSAGGPANKPCFDSQGNQTSITASSTNRTFMVTGLKKHVAVEIVSIDTGSVGIKAVFTNSPPSSATQSITNSQGNKGSVSQSWYVQLADGTYAISMDNGATKPALPVSQYAKGAGTNGDTAIRLATSVVQLKAQSITTGTPVSVYTPASGKKFVAKDGAISVSVSCSVLIEDGSGTEVARTPVLNPGEWFDLAKLFGNGLRSATANNHLYLDTTAASGTAVTVSGAILMSGDE